MRYEVTSLRLKSRQLSQIRGQVNPGHTLILYLLHSHFNIAPRSPSEISYVRFSGQNFGCGCQLEDLRLLRCCAMSNDKYSLILRGHYTPPKHRKIYQSIWRNIPQNLNLHHHWSFLCHKTHNVAERQKSSSVDEHSKNSETVPVRLKHHTINTYGWCSNWKILSNGAVRKNLLWSFGLVRLLQPQRPSNAVRSSSIVRANGSCF